MSANTEIGIYLSGGAGNKNPFLSTGGAISTTLLPQGQGSKSFNNLWSDISMRQARYGYKDLRILYFKNISADKTFKNARVYWNQSDTFTSMQVGRAGVNQIENSTLSLASVQATDLPIPPALWATAAAVTSQFRVIQDFNDLTPTSGHGFAGDNEPSSKLGVHVADSSAAIYNHAIHRFSAVLRRVGVPSGNVNCKIWDSNDNEKASLGSVPASSIVESTGAGGPNTVAVFTNTENTYKLKAGDIVGLEYPDAGQDEDDGDPNDHMIWEKWGWSGSEASEPEENISKDIPGTDRWSFRDGRWQVGAVEGTMVELKYRAETQETLEGGCTPVPDDGSGSPNPPPGETPESPTGFVIMSDFSSLSATTGYPVGNGGSDNIFRRAVKIESTAADILEAPIARFTILARRIGNPTTSMSCKIWDMTGNVKVNLGTLNVTSITNVPGQWSQIAFTNEQNEYKMNVNDLIGIEYGAGTQTDHIVLAGWSWASASATSAALEGAQPMASTDKFGVRMVYQNSGNFRYDWEIPSNSNSMRWDLTNPPLNMEMTGYFFKSSPSSDTTSCKIRGGRHTDSASKDGCCYILQFPCTGGTMQFEIECPHPENHDCPTSGIDGTALSLGTYHGYKVAVWNLPNGGVHMEAWQDKGDASGGTPPNQWEKLQVHEDFTGDCGDIDTPLIRPKGSTSQCTFRIDNNSGTVGKWLSCVEIQPGGAQPPPTEPPTDDGGGGSNPGVNDKAGTSIARWNGSAWTTDDGGMSDLVYRAEKYIVLTGELPEEEKILIDPGNKRKPTSYDQGIILPPLAPNEYKGIIFERLYPPSGITTMSEITQQIICEVDATTDPPSVTDPGLPPTPESPVPPAPEPVPLPDVPIPEPPTCPAGQHYDPIQGLCVQDAGSPGTTTDGIILPSLPTTTYSYDPIDYTATEDHNDNGSFREDFERGDRDLNSVLIGGYIKCDGPDDEEISGILGGGSHSNSDGGRAGRCYSMGVRFDGTRARVRKENPHPEYHSGAEQSCSLGDRQGHYTGVMFMKVNIVQNGEEVVKLMIWVDTAGMADNGTFTSGNQNWQKVFDKVDTGNWFEDPYLTCKVAGNSQATLRVDEQTESSYDAKFIFCARIKGGPAY